MDGVVDEACEVCYAVVDVGTLVHPDERLVEDGEEVAEEVDCCRLFDDLEHHLLVTLASVEFQQLLQARKELCSRTHGLVDVFDGIIPSNVCVESLSNLLGRKLRVNLVGLHNLDKKVDLLGLRLAPDDTLFFFRHVCEGLDLLTIDAVIDLRSKRLNGTLDNLNTIADGEPEHSL